jgi:signal transduction histidine kinase
MNSPLLGAFIYFGLGTLQFSAAALILWQRGWAEETERNLAVFALLSAMWEWALGLAPWVKPLGSGGLDWLAAYGVLAQAGLFFWLTRAFLRDPARVWIWLLPGAACAAAILALQAGWLSGVPPAWPRPLLSMGLALAGWGAYMAGSIVKAIQAYRRADKPLHRNRIIYWYVALGLAVVTDLFFISRNDSAGGLPRLLEIGTLTYIVVNHRLPDIRHNIRRAAAYLLVGFAAAFIYVFAIAALDFGLRTTQGYGLWASLGLTFLFVALLLHPLVQLLQNVAIQRATGAGYDSAETVRDYGDSISNILNIERLAEKVSTLISDTMNAAEVRLLLVDHTRATPAAYRLQTVQQTERDKSLDGILSGDNPVASYLAVEGRPLAQYDIDLLPRYRTMADSERQWLTNLHNDVYVPIHARGQWIGLLTLGPKLTGDRYFDRDMALLNTLADQTAIALENARLVSDLVGLNRELKQAFADLEKAHRQLNELDRLKSAFIGAITHELRTPVANMQFSIQLIEKHGLDNLAPDLRAQFQQLIDSAGQSRLMVDNLVNFATFLGKQGDLKLGGFSFSELLGETVVMLEPHARRKSIVLRTDVADEGIPEVVGDRARLGEAIYHLIQNAIKFTGPEGTVTARAWASEGLLHFEVKDTGVGVPPDKLPGLWAGFSQLADPLRRGLEGLGLGLALVKYVVTAHDGDTTAQSAGLPGQGSTFGFSIPLQGPKPHASMDVDELDLLHSGEPDSLGASDEYDDVRRTPLPPQVPPFIQDETAGM